MGTTADLRQQYLDKVRAVEKTKEYLESQSGAGGSVASGTGQGFEGQVSVPAGSFSFPASAFTPTQLAKYPNMLNDLASHAVPVHGSIDISTASFAQSGRIAIPTGDRSQYAATMAKYIIENGGVKNCGLFSPIDDRKFNFISLRDDNPDSVWLRRDLLFYLEALQARIGPILGTDKITISSGYRSPYYNYDLYSRYLADGTSSKRVYWSPHLGGFAVDVTTGNAARSRQVYNIADSMGFGGLGLGDTFVHMDVGPHSRWTY